LYCEISAYVVSSLGKTKKVSWSNSEWKASQSQSESSSIVKHLCIPFAG